MTKHRSERPPLWALGIGAALAMLRSGKRQEGDTSPVPQEQMGQHKRSDGRIGAPAQDAKGSGKETGGKDRGRHARSPTQIPPKGWKDIALRVYNGISEDRILAIAAGVTFYVLLALFPGIAGLISLYGLFADPASINQHINALSGVLPEGGLEVIRGQLERLTSQPSQKLGLATFIGLAISLWSANGGMKALFDALNIVYHEKEKRGFFKLNAISLACTLGAMAFVILALAGVAVVPVALNYIGLSQTTELLINIGRWPLMLIIVCLAIGLIYRFGPSRDEPKWRWITPGSICATILWIVASLLFSWYTANFGSYNATYGSLGAVIGFMTWLWISSIVILLGGELNAEMEHQTAEDSTEGKPQPMGQRGAHMADTLGASQG